MKVSNKKRRDRYQVVANFLELVLTYEPIGITKLIYHSYLPYRTANLHLIFLTKEGLLAKVNSGYYRITDKGRHVLSVLTEMNEMLNTIHKNRQ